MAGEGADDAYRLLKAVFYFKAQTVETNNFHGTQGRISGHQQATTPGWMNNHHEAYESSNGPPKQVADPVLEGDIFLAIDRAGGLFHCLPIGEQ